MAGASPLTEMTRLERWMINSPPRCWLFHLEFRSFWRLAERRGFAEPSRRRLQHGIFRFTRHDPEAMFDRAEMSQAPAGAGLEVIEPLGSMSLWDVVGLARRPFPADGGTA